MFGGPCFRNQCEHFVAFFLRGNAYPATDARKTKSGEKTKTAIQDMEDYLAGQQVEQDHVIACEIVTGENVDNYEAFN